MNDLANILDRLSQADVVIMDFSKAVDQRLLSKLRHFWIRVKLHNFLTMRTQQVVLKGAFSSSITVISGVPQGMVLAPCFLS